MYRSEFSVLLQKLGNGVEKFQATYVDFVQITAKNILNRGGMVVAVFPDEHRILDDLARDDLFRVVLEVPVRGAWVGDLPDVTSQAPSWGTQRITFMYALYRDKQITVDEFGNVYHMLYIMHPFEVLSRYVSGFPAGTNGKSQWRNRKIAELANDLLVWNVTADGTTANGRVRDSNIVRGFEDAGSIAGTPEIDFQIQPGTPILDVLHDLSKLGEFNFSVTVSDTHQPAGLISVQSPLTGGSIGADLTDRIVFAQQLDNANKISIGGDSLSEKTVAIVGGGGEGGSRTFEVRTGPNHATPDNDYETWVNASTLEGDELATAGDKALARMQARQRFDSQVGDSLGYIPQRDFTIGDVVKARFDDAEFTQRIDSIELTMDQTQRVSIAIELQSFIGGA